MIMTRKRESPWKDGLGYKCGCHAEYIDGKLYWTSCKSKMDGKKRKKRK